jgi:hypothetical protein
MNQSLFFIFLSEHRVVWQAGKSVEEGEKVRLHRLLASTLVIPLFVQPCTTYCKFLKIFLLATWTLASYNKDKGSISFGASNMPAPFLVFLYSSRAIS